ncbi:MAG: hypothetical protein CMO80_11380 [Verrucomicrobiales bacterium]|nr:hypothetical protein [Verrucomicrobiales bacterium]|tara:strand:- start:10635 stop:13862 length:3228 start_codon:yes stop_codon:yes gene_type:complete
MVKAGNLPRFPGNTFDLNTAVQQKQTPFLDKRLIIGLLLTIGVAMSFWMGSRYPDLREKSAIGAERDLQGIAFDVVLEVKPEHPTWKKIIFTTVNWMETNKKGMAFGLVFAACLLTILSFIENSSFTGLMANTFKGFLIGAPLGLCVNCAAPVAFGLQKGGSKPETALGAMLSSPSMNVIVIGMMFSLLPWYVAALKLVASLILIFAFVPLLVKLAPPEWITQKTSEAEACPIDAVCDLSASQGWGGDLKWVFNTFSKNLWKVGKQVVPLMLLAGFLGSLLITLLPFELTKSIAEAGDKYPFLPVVLCLALVGVFLPVPMAFDVVMVVILMGLGIPIGFIAVLLITLGSYSFYSYIIVARAFSHQAALTVTVVVVLIAVGAGYAAPHLKQVDENHFKDVMNKYFLESDPLDRDLPTVPAATPWAKISAELGKAPIQLMAFTQFTNQHPGEAQIAIQSFDLDKQTPGEGKLFKRRRGEDIGFDIPTYFAFQKLIIYPQIFTRGLAAGDVHGDNYPDLLVCGDPNIGGLYLFANIRGERFVRQELDLGRFNNYGIFSGALVDLNNDGWLDVVFTTLDNGNHYILNRQGQFLDQPRMLSHKSGTSAISMGFADFDENGLLDAFVCHYTIGHVGEIHPISHEVSRNQILFNRGRMFEPVDMPSIPGETHGVLVTDLNDDGRNDFICYNDWTIPDMYYLGKADGSFQRLGESDRVIPETGEETMSICSADIDNDLVPELYVTQVSGHEDEEEGWDIQIPLSELQNHAESDEERELMRRYEQKLKIFSSDNHMMFVRFVPEELRQDWIAYRMVRRVARTMDPNYRVLVPQHRKDVHMFINRIGSPYQPMAEVKDSDIPGEIPQNRKNVNIFLKRVGDEFRYEERAADFKLQNAGWTWNVDFADVNNDEFQDVYVATGFFQFHKRDNNVFFMNRGGKRFDQVTEESGLTDYLSTSAFSHVDFDRDGDVDIMSLPVTMASVRLFENQGTKGNSITIQLRDFVMNRFAIGAKIIIRYGDGKNQMREIKASGGFVSFNPLEAHFGLGENEEVKEIEIRWPGRATTKLSGPFPANRVYRVHRTGAR